MGKKGEVVRKQQLSDEFLDGFHACEETTKVEETAVCSETDVDAVWQVLFCLTEHDAKLLALDKRLSRFLLSVASLEMILLIVNILAKSKNTSIISFTHQSQNTSCTLFY